MTAEQRESVEKELSVLPQAQREAAERQITRIRFDDSLGGNRYEPRTKEVILSPERQPGDLIHEYGHALERKLKIYKGPAFLEVKAQGIDLADKTKIVYDDSTFTQSIWRLENEKLISVYQGRLYIKDMAATEVVDIDLMSMKEYFSEGYREFYSNPKNLREHDPALFNYIWRLFYDRE